MNSSQELLNKIRPLYIVCKVFGLTPFSIDYLNMTLKINKCDTLYVVAALGWQITGAAVMILVYFSNTFGGNRLPLNLHVTASLASTVTTILTMLLELLFNVPKYQRMLHLAVKSRDELSQLMAVTDIPLSTAWKVVPLVMIACLISSTAGVAAYKGLLFLLPLMAFFLTNMLITLASLYKFYFLVLMVRNRICAINNYLSAKSVSSFSQSIFIKSSKKFYTEDGESPNMNAPLSSLQAKTYCHRIRSIRRAYVFLSDICTEILSAHQLFIALQLPLILLQSTVLTYLLVTMLKEKWHLAFTQIQQLLCSLTFEVMKLLLMLVPTHVAACKVKETCTTVSRLLLDVPLNTRVETELLVMLQQIKRCMPIFNLFGVVTLDFRLLASFLSALTTYTVLLLSSD